MRKSVNKQYSSRGAVRHQLTEWIHDGRIAPGTPFPAERTLAQELGVARKTVRAALAELEQAGTLRAVGNRRLVTPVASAPSVMSRTVVMLSNYNVEDLAATPLSPGWDPAILLHAMAACSRHGFNPMPLNARTLSQERLQAILREQPIGILFAFEPGDHSCGPPLLRACMDTELPMVVLGYAPDHPQISRIVADHQQGAAALVAWAIAHGGRQIAQLWMDPHSFAWATHRRVGYENALATAGLPPDVVKAPVLLEDLPPGLIPQIAARQEAYTLAGILAERYLKKGFPDTFLVQSDPHAFLLATALRTLGQNLETFTILGYDHTYPDDSYRQLGCAHFATVDRDTAAIGRGLMDQLQEIIAGHRQNECRLVPPRLCPLR